MQYVQEHRFCKTSYHSVETQRHGEKPLPLTNNKISILKVNYEQ